jgi:hypothetical protein
LPLALLALFVGYLLINAGVRNQHPWAEIVQAFGGSPPGAPGVSPGQPDSITPPGQGPIQGPPGLGPEAGTSQGTLAVQAFDRAVMATRFGKRLTNVGVCACRTINPHSGGSSSTWSQHAWCNAKDYGGSAVAMAQLMVFANANRRRYKLANIIPPGSAINVVHVDFLPAGKGTPPCAS